MTLINMLVFMPQGFVSAQKYINDSALEWAASAFVANVLACWVNVTDLWPLSIVYESAEHIVGDIRAEALE